MERMRLLGLLVFVAPLCVLGSWQRAGAREWDAVKPVSLGRGDAVSLTTVRDKAEGMPVARVTTRTLNEWKDKQIEFRTRFDTTLSPGPKGAKGEPQVDATIEFGSLQGGGDEMGPRIRAAGLQITVRSVLDDQGTVRSGKTSGAEQLGSVGRFLSPTGSWLLPSLPAEPVQVGTAWDLPIPYFLWSIGQLGGVRAKGFVQQVFEAVEVREGVRCARIRTVASLERAQPEGMTPEHAGIGTDAALAKFRATGMTWLGLDGCVRHDELRVRMRVENTKTKAAMNWTLDREIVAQPQSKGALPTDWARLMGDGPFVHGYKAGIEEGKLAGRALACFVGKYGDANAEQFAAVLGTPATRKKLSAYIPVLVDPENFDGFPEAEMAKLSPGYFFIGNDGGTIFQILGMGVPPELVETMTDIPAQRAPEPKPTEAYLALETIAATMRSAREGNDVPAALAAIAALRKEARGYALQDEANTVERALADEGRERVDAARAMSADQAKQPAALKALAAVAKAYAGHAVEQLARDTMTAIKADVTIEDFAKKHRETRKAKDEAKLDSINLSLMPTRDELRQMMKDDDAGQAFVKAYPHVKSAAQDAKVMKKLRKSLLVAPAHRSNIVATSASAAEIVEYAKGSNASKEFPRGMRKFARLVRDPKQVFYVVEFLQPGKDVGTKFTCFTKIGGRWVFLMKPWRTLK